MSRKTWSGVLVVLLLLVVPGSLSPVRELVRHLDLRLLRQVAGPDPARTLMATMLLLALASVLLVVGGAAARFAARGPRGVRTLARRGQPLPDIARHLRLSQDAVRLVLRTECRPARPRL